MFEWAHVQKALRLLRIALAMIVLGVGVVNLVVYHSHPELLSATEGLFMVLLLIYVIELFVGKNSKGR